MPNLFRVDLRSSAASAFICQLVTIGDDNCEHVDNPSPECPLSPCKRTSRSRPIDVSLVPILAVNMRSNVRITEPSAGKIDLAEHLGFYGRSWYATISTVDTPRYGF